MTLSELFQLYTRHPLLANAKKAISKDTAQLSVSGLQGSALSLFVAALHESHKDCSLLVADDQETAAYRYNDLMQLLGQENVLYFPSPYRKRFRSGERDTANEILRTDVLNHLSDSNSHSFVVTYPEALVEKVITTTDLRAKVLTLAKGEGIEPQTIVDILLDNGFERVDFVYEAGQFSLRGSIMDIFSFSNELPYRIDFFGNEIDSIRLFDIETQLSENTCQEMSVIPNVSDSKEKKSDSISFMDFLPKGTHVFLYDTDFVSDSINTVYDQTLIDDNDNAAKRAKLVKEMISGEDFGKSIENFKRIYFANKTKSKSVESIEFKTTPQPLFHKNFELVAKSFLKFIDDGFKLYILSDSVKQTDRIRAIFEDQKNNIPFTPVLKTLHEGFSDSDLGICIFTDHQLFDRYHKYTLRSDKAHAGKAILTLKDLNQFQIGDYVTHIDHGVGKFGGLLTTDINGKRQEVIKLVYKDDDIIFVNIHNLHRIAKYKGKDGVPPKISKLGSGAWEHIKERTKKKVKDIARDLIKLYAKRKTEKGFAYSPDSYMQHEMEDSFIYEDTPDQEKASVDVKKDMEKSLPMDRLICGDVGFGKTEIAMRAAFKAVTDGKQVAVLVPTTVLAMQHYNTFKERLGKFSCTIDYLSRARKAADVKELLNNLKDGKIDILIGTHRIVGKSVKFKDLGLLVIDEEQKFGVAVKEKLKAMKVNVDTITMTATPIPRTLQFSLLGARDLSVITTPPPNRYPVQTELSTFDTDILKEAIEHEMSRNGQVYIINNRIHNIYDLEATVHKAVPEARIIVGHGQMEPEKLEKIITDFINYEYDVLIATTIIESGIDIPNANTIIINEAQHFGLSDLHQLRGRVGRSNRKAYCYLMAPPLSTLTADARRRLQAFETLSELGSGFNIAMMDLDIRGAGNMLGAEQSGFIADLGYETYQKILNEAVHELKDEEFATLYKDEIQESGEKLAFVTDCQIETDLSLMMPKTYIENISERMALYRQLDNLSNESQLDTFRKDMEDRFGKIPSQVEELFNMLRLRWTAIQLGMERIVLKNSKMICYIVSNEKSPYFQTNTFGGILSYIAMHTKDCQLKEQNGKRSIRISNVASVDTSCKVLQEMKEMAAHYAEEEK